MFEHESDSKGIVVNMLQAGTLALALLFLAPLQLQLSFGQDGVAVLVQTDESTSVVQSSTESTENGDEIVEEAPAATEEEIASTDQKHHGSEEDSVETSIAPDSEVSDDESMDMEAIAGGFQDSEAVDRTGDQPKSDEVVELSVEPGTEPVLPEDVPAWIMAKPDYSTEVHRIVVDSEVVGDPDEVDAALDRRLVAAVKNYIDDKVFNARGESDILDVDARFIRRNLINDAQGEVLELNASGEPMFKKWVMVEITPEQREYFQQKHRESMQLGRLAPLTAGLVALLGVVGFSHLLLRRKHGLATAQPLAGDGLVANPVSAATKRSGGGILGFLLLGFGLLVSGVLLLGFLSLFVAYESVEYHPDQLAPAQLSDIPAMPAMPDMPAMPETPDMPVENRAEGGYTHETTITSGGQTIHIKRK
ncbi:MAG: hypothetical protein ACE361_05995 [Aureliella sp.]